MSLSFGKVLAFFDPGGHGVTTHPERALDASGAGPLLVGVEDALLICFVVTAFSWVLAVLFAAVEASVALSAVVGVTVGGRSGSGGRSG